MGKGAGTCVGRASLALAASSTPGKSARAQHTYLLMKAAGGFEDNYLLRDLKNPQQTLPSEKVDAPTTFFTTRFQAAANGQFLFPQLYADGTNCPAMLTETSTRNA